MDFIDAKAQARIERRGISIAQANACIDSKEDHYTHRREVIFTQRQPNGQLMKVAVRDKRIVNALLV